MLLYFGKYNLQCNLGMDSPGSRKHNADLQYLKIYIYEYDPWLGIILAAISFTTCSAEDRLKGYIPEKLLFGHYMILPIKYTVNW